MPAYNEADTIVHNILETKNAVSAMFPLYEIIVVDDGSSDNMYSKILNAYQNDHSIIVKRTKKNHGKGRALKYGFRFAAGELIAFLDADLDLHPAQIAILYNVMLDSGADIVIGSKRHPASVLTYSKRRQAASYLYNFIVRCMFLTKIKDTQTGIKLFKYNILKTLFRKSMVCRYAFDVELLMIAHHLGYIIKDAPIKLTFTRAHRLGRMKIKDFMKTLGETFFIFYHMYIKRTYLKR